MEEVCSHETNEQAQRLQVHRWECERLPSRVGRSGPNKRGEARLEGAQLDEHRGCRGLNGTATRSLFVSTLESIVEKEQTSMPPRSQAGLGSGDSRLRLVESGRR